MGIQRKSIQGGIIGPDKLTPSFRKHRYFYEPFCNQPLVTAPAGYGDPAGTDDTVHRIFSGFNLFELQNEQAQTILVPTLTTDSHWDIGYDQTLANGVEINFGSLLQKTHPRNFTVGTDECFFRVYFQIEDVSGADLQIGFRKASAYAATVGAYTDYAMLRVLGDSSSAAGAVGTHVRLNTGTAAEKAITTLADTIAMEFEIQVKGLNAYFFINGAPINGPVFAFDTTDILCPVINHLVTTDLPGEVKLIAAEGGLLEDHPGGTLA